MTKESTPVVQETNNKPKTLKEFFANDEVKNKFKEVLGDRAGTFTASVLTIASQNEKLKNCVPLSIYMGAMMAASLNLQIHPSLGEAYIIPYGDQAQFQIGYKGLIQLALRSGQFKNISSCAVYEGQLIKEDPLKGFEFDWTKKTSDTIIGYAAYFSLLNGFEKTYYLTKAEVEKHGKRFSKTYNFGPWKSDFDEMAKKTVLKLLIGRYAPRSVDMQRAVIADQAVVNNVETMDVSYIDEGANEITKEFLQELYEQKKAEGIVFDTPEVTNIERILKKEEVSSYKKLYELLKSKVVVTSEKK